VNGTQMNFKHISHNVQVSVSFTMSNHMCPCNVVTLDEQSFLTFAIWFPRA